MSDEALRLAQEHIANRGCSSWCEYCVVARAYIALSTRSCSECARLTEELRVAQRDLAAWKSCAEANSVNQASMWRTNAQAAEQRAEAAERALKGKG
jgi:hypothetical protein